MGCTAYVVSLLLLLFYFLGYSTEAQNSEKLKSQDVSGCERPPVEQGPLSKESAEYEKIEEEKEHKKIQKIKESNHLVVLLVFAFLICGVLFGLWAVTFDTSNATTSYVKADGVLLDPNVVKDLEGKLSKAEVTIRDNEVKIKKLNEQIDVLSSDQTEMLQNNEQLKHDNEHCTLENKQHKRDANAVVVQDKDTDVSTMLETTQDVSDELLFVLASKMQGSVVVRIDQLDILEELTHQFGLTLQGQTQTLVAANEEFDSIISSLFDQSNDDDDESKWRSNPLIDLVYISEKYAPRIFSFQNVAEETLLRLKSDLESTDSRTAMDLMYTKISQYLQYQLEHDAFSDELFLSHAKSLEKIDLLHALHSRDDHSIAMCVLLQESLLHLDKQSLWSRYFGSNIDKPDVIRAHLNTLHDTCRTINVETVQVLSLISWPSQTFQVKELSLQFKKVLLTRSNLKHLFQSPLLQALDKVSQEPKAEKSSWALGWQSSEKDVVDSSIGVLQALQNSEGN
jgi:regulator of replication initiation timing